MKNIKKILAIITIISIISSIGLGWLANFKSNEAKRFEDNYRASRTKIIKYRDANNNLVTEIIELRLTTDEIKNSSDSTIRALANEILSMGINMKRVERVNQILSETKNSGTSVFQDTNIIIYNDTIPFYKPIKTTTITDGYLFADLQLDSNMLKWEYTYIDSLLVVDNKKRDPLVKKGRRQGKKRFIVFQWLAPRWIHKTSVKSYNPNTEITGVLKVEVENRKGKKRSK